MLQYIQSNDCLLVGIRIIALIIVSGVLFYTYKKRGVAGLRKEAYKLFLVAERSYKESGLGKQKFDYVIGMVYSRMPTMLRLLVPQAQLEKIIQTWFDEIKDLLDDGKFNDSNRRDGQ